MDDSVITIALWLILGMVLSMLPPVVVFIVGRVVFRLWELSRTQKRIKEKLGSFARGLEEDPCGHWNLIDSPGITRARVLEEFMPGWVLELPDWVGPATTARMITEVERLEEMDRIMAILTMGREAYVEATIMIAARQHPTSSSIEEEYFEKNPGLAAYTSGLKVPNPPTQGSNPVF